MIDSMAQLKEFAKRHDIPLHLPTGTGFVSIAASSGQHMVGELISCWEKGCIPVLPPRTGNVDFKNLEKRAHFLEEAKAGRKLFGAFTSGSTAASSFHIFDLDRAFANARAHAKSLHLSGTSSIVQALPMEHIFGLIAYALTPAALGAKTIFSAAPFDWTYFHFEEKSVLHLIPDQLRAFEKLVWPKPVNVSVGAGLASGMQMDRLCEFPGTLNVTYGLTEAGPRVSSGKWGKGRPEGWIGEIFPEIQWRLEDLEDTPLKLLKVKSPFVALTAELDREGYLCTGDLFEQSPKGELIFRARRNAGFKYRGRLFTSHDFSAVKKELGLEETALLLRFTSPEELVLFGAAEEKRFLWLEVFHRLGLPRPSFATAAHFAGDKMGKNSVQLAVASLSLSRQPASSMFV